MLEGPKAVCAQCHDAGTPGAKVAAQMAEWLDDWMRRSNILKTCWREAKRAGMEVSEAQAKLATAGKIWSKPGWRCTLFNRGNA